MSERLALSKLVPGAVCGTFRLREATHSATWDGYPFLRMLLEDFSGQIHAYAWTDELIELLDLPDYSLVRIAGQVRRYRGKLRIDVTSVQPLLQPVERSAAALIPRGLCPVPELLPTLMTAVEQICLPPLRGFVESVLADTGICFPFVSAPASLQHHHRFPGGLLRHSLECFFLVAKHQEFARESCELGMVAALFHDVGKILTLTHRMRRTSLGASVDHDKLTLEVLAPHLRLLDREWPEGGRELRYLLTWKMCEKIPKYDMADLVACCDRISTGLNRRSPHAHGRNCPQLNSADHPALRMS
ncbi:MAG: HD domain-containing protein [Geoalkalibacter sp.]|uniref:HD domain-containing protein n=1 Tax=Geoalkalibacter sp. TaxID=3041440 RepID=UPI003D14951F